MEQAWEEHAAARATPNIQRPSSNRATTSLGFIFLILVLLLVLAPHPPELRPVRPPGRPRRRPLPNENENERV
jgi:hypothetical protein